MTSSIGKQITKIHILCNISRSKDVQTMKLGIRSIFLKNHTQNVVEKLVPDPFLKIKIDDISGWSTVRNFLQLAFIVRPSPWLPKYMEVKVLNTCFYIVRPSPGLPKYIEGKVLTSSLPDSFFAWFLNKNISDVTCY